MHRARVGALRLLAWLAGQLGDTPTANILYLGPCPQCGAWRCPDCRGLIHHREDHAWSCRRKYNSTPGGQ